MHVFDNTVMPPRQMATLTVRDQPGWVTFSIDGAHAYPSTGEVFETKTKRLVKSLKDEVGRDVGSEKLLEVDFENGKAVAAGNSFGTAGQGRDGSRAVRAARRREADLSAGAGTAKVAGSVVRERRDTLGACPRRMHLMPPSSKRAAT